MRKFKTNLNTDFLKIVAVVAMTVDHAAVFWPEQAVLRWIGRIAFPIFCYCLTVGLVYTRDVKRYLARLLIFAVVSQLFYVMALYDPYDFLEYLWVKPNILFTLFLSLLTMYGVKEKKWWWAVVGALPLALLDFDYNLVGVGLMLIFYFCRQKPLLGAGLYTIYYIWLAVIRGSLSDPLALKIGEVALGFEIFALAAAPFIFIRWPELKIKINKWLFYLYYLVHLYVIMLLRVFLGA